MLIHSFALNDIDLNNKYFDTRYNNYNCYHFQESNAADCQQVSALLELLEQKPQGVFNKFKESLHETLQSYIVDEILETAGKLKYINVECVKKTDLKIAWCRLHCRN